MVYSVKITDHNMTDPGALTAQFTTLIRERVRRGEIVLQFVGIVREAAREMEGKRITKRFATRIKERAANLMPRLSVYYSNEYGRYAIEAWGTETVTYGDRISIMIGRPEKDSFSGNFQETISESYIVENNAAYFSEAEKLTLLRAALDSGAPARWIERAVAIQRARKSLAADLQAAGLSYLLEF